MHKHSRQLESVVEAFGRQGWHCEAVEGREVLRAGFEAHHTRVDLIVQVYPSLNGLSMVSEAPLEVDEEHLPAVLELLARGNKPLTLGGFEYDLDRGVLVFRLSNLFERERFDGDIISSLVHCAIAELDRMMPYVGVVRDTPADLLEELDLAGLLQRDDLLPPVPSDEEEEY